MTLLQEVPFQLLADTQPPILGKSMSMPSNPFVEKLVQALEPAPRRLRNALTTWGYKIVAASSLSAFLPEPSASVNVQDYLNKPIPVSQFNRLAHKLSRRSLWATMPSGSLIFPKTVMMPEMPLLCIGMIQTGGMQQLLSPYSRVDGEVVLQNLEMFSVENEPPGKHLLHELGHAIDDYLGKHPEGIGAEGIGFLSSSSKFSEAYKDDVQAIADPQHRNQFAYLLPRADNPTDINGEARKEAFAELFARILVSNGNPEEHAKYQTSFPKVSAFIKQVVISRWMSEAERNTQVPPQEVIVQTREFRKQLMLAENELSPGAPASSVQDAETISGRMPVSDDAAENPFSKAI
jgi:hypothetical protein